MLNLAKAMQRKVKGQPSEVADAMYTKAVEFYRYGSVSLCVLHAFTKAGFFTRRGLEKCEDCDAYVNAGTALINHANLRVRFLFGFCLFDSLVFYHFMTTAVYHE